MTRTLRPILISAAVALSTPSLIAADDAPAAQQMPVPKADVFVVRPVAKLPVNFDYPARLVSVRSAGIVARVQGLLLEQKFSEGSFVKKGTSLFTIEPDLYAATLREREAELAVAEADMTNAEQDWKRVEALYKKKAVSTKEYDAAYASYHRAKASVTAAKARIESARLDVEYTDVLAPISGIAGMKQSDVGNIVNPGTPLVRITQTDPIHAEFSIPDTEMQKIKAGLKNGSWSKSGGDAVQVSFESNGIKAEGVVDFFAPVVDDKTATVQARATLANPDNALMAGSFGRVTITGLERNNVLMVPQKAVLQNPKGTIVFIVEDGKAAVRPVKIGDTEGENFIVEGPLRPGDKVIVNNFFRVKPGMPVAVDKTINDEKE